MTAYQLDMYSPSGRERVGRADDQPTGGRTLRERLWRRIRRSETDVRDVARRVGRRPRWLTAYLRGDEEADDVETVGRLDLAARGR